MPTITVEDKTAQLETLLEERILILDGAMGTQIQDLRLDEAAVRGDRFAGHDKDLKNFADILCITRPDDITAIHRRYLEGDRLNPVERVPISGRGACGGSRSWWAVAGSP